MACYCQLLLLPTNCNSKEDVLNQNLKNGITYVKEMKEQ